MIALGCDHGGYELKQEIIKYLEEKGIPYQDFGCDSTKSVDYPVYARKVGRAIQNGVCDKGILICGTGIGISIAANKMKGIRRPYVQTASVQKLPDFTTMPISWRWEDG